MTRLLSTSVTAAAAQCVVVCGDEVRVVEDGARTASNFAIVSTACCAACLVYARWTSDLNWRRRANLLRDQGAAGIAGMSCRVCLGLVGECPDGLRRRSKPVAIQCYVAEFCEATHAEEVAVPLGG